MTTPGGEFPYPSFDADAFLADINSGNQIEEQTQLIRADLFAQLDEQGADRIFGFDAIEEENRFNTLVARKTAEGIQNPEGETYLRYRLESIMIHFIVEDTLRQNDTSQPPISLVELTETKKLNMARFHAMGVALDDPLMKLFGQKMEGEGLNPDTDFQLIIEAVNWFDEEKNQAPQLQKAAVDALNEINHLFDDRPDMLPEELPEDSLEIVFTLIRRWSEDARILSKRSLSVEDHSRFIAQQDSMAYDILRNNLGFGDAAIKVIVDHLKRRFPIQVTE